MTFTKHARNHFSIHTCFFPVLVPPQWATDPPPKNITIVIEKNGTLECKVTAKPSAQVSWYKNGQLLQPSEYVHFIALHDIDQISRPCIIFIWRGPRSSHGSILLTKHCRNLCSLLDWLILSLKNFASRNNQSDQTQISVIHY